MKYPSGIKRKANNPLTYSNRGMQLEEDINITNKYYLENNIANIHKKPTPITICKVDYSNKEAMIKEAYFRTPSTTDYNGVYKGKYIDFEAKETKKKTSFPLSNIHIHQINHLKDIVNHGGIGFLIVRFTTIDKTYLLMEKDLTYFIENNNKKSIPLEYFNEKAFVIKNGYSPRIDYLKVLDSIYGGKYE